MDSDDKVYRLRLCEHRRSLKICGLLLLLAQVVSAEVVKIEIRGTADAGTHERVFARVHYAVDPKLPANRDIADIDLAPKNARGMVEFEGDVLFFRPKVAKQARGTVLIDVVNRGQERTFARLSGAVQQGTSPESWNVGDGFLLEQGFTLAFLGWDFQPTQGLTFKVPIAPVEGIVREHYIQSDPGKRSADFTLTFCALEPARKSATLTFRTKMDGTPQPLPREKWQFSTDGCSVHLGPEIGVGLYEVVYQAKGSPLAGLGMAAVRDFASYLKYGPASATLRENPAAVQRTIGYGYSQSARFLREFVRGGFNADERGRAAYDGLLISSAGAGGGSFNHRFAMPTVAGNSVLAVLRPVDLPPFTDDGMLAKSESAKVAPKIFYTDSSTEYWARAAALTHTDDGRKDVPLAPTSRLYFVAGTPHVFADPPLSKSSSNSHFQYYVNVAQYRWVGRALLMNLDAWTRNESEPPPSQYPSISKGELVPLQDVRFPTIPSHPFTTYMPQVWRMDFGARFVSEKVITKEPPSLGAPFRVLVPQVNADGNEIAGIHMPEVAVPLGTYTGWNVSVPQLADLGYLSGLVGAFEPFPLTKEQREKSGDARLSIGERYADRQDYRDRVKKAAESLVHQRFMLGPDVPAVILRAEELWNAVVSTGSR